MRVTLKTPSKSGKSRPTYLSERAKQFCRNIVAGMTQMTAYREAGFTSKGKAAPFLLMKRREVGEYLDRLYEKQRLRLNVTMDSLVLDLRRAQDLAIETGNAAAHTTATMGLAKLMGFLKEDRDGDVNIFINRPLRESTNVIELSPDEWVAKWSPAIEHKTNGHGNGKG